MCGIAGLLSAQGWTEECLARVQVMTDAQRHRGPDDAGCEVLQRAEPGVAFGHRRLAIIDLSPDGHQPMTDPDRGLWITFNGEVYNYRILRRELEQCGHHFRSRTDTEVILKAYAAWGADAVRRLRGIFAFAIWDSRAQTLLLARDQLGVKPLYYWSHNGVLLFASEVRALLASQLVHRRLDPSGLMSYLAYGAVQEPYTLIRGVRSLPPGHTLTWRTNNLALHRYWHLPAAGAIPQDVPADILEQTAQHLSEAVKLQLVADVPLGAFLSGGIDSTAITALMRQAANGPVKTFSLVFDEKAYDEREYARTAARHIGTDHTELRLSGDQVRASLPAVLAAFDQPSVDGVNTYFVSKVTREAGLTVALSGLGGDELFGGYDGYRRSLLLERLEPYRRRIPYPFRSSAAAAIDTFGFSKHSRRVSAFLQSDLHPYFDSRRHLTDKQIASLVCSTIVQRSTSWRDTSFAQLEQETADYDPINRSSALEMKTYMLSMLLRDADQMSMAHALELRVPLIDHILVEQVFALPGSCKTDRLQPKPLLTRSLGSALPSQCVHRPKRGFELPFPAWMRQSLNDELRSVFLHQSPDRPAFFRQSGLAKLWNAFARGQLGWHIIWSVFVLNDWLTRHDIG